VKRRETYRTTSIQSSSDEFAAQNAAWVSRLHLPPGNPPGAASVPSGARRAIPRPSASIKRPPHEAIGGSLAVAIRPVLRMRPPGVLRMRTKRWHLTSSSSEEPAQRASQGRALWSKPIIFI